MFEQGCTNPDLGDLLSAYEMGLLEQKDQTRFETHLVECPVCLEDLYDGAVASEALRADPGRYARVLAAAARSTQPSLLDRLGSFFSGLLRPRVLAPVGVVAAMALFLMVFQPGQLPSSAGLRPRPHQTQTSGRGWANKLIPFKC